jgi:hypothetical protein
MQPVMGPPMPTNMVSDAEIRTGLAEVPNTPAYRAQLQGQLKEVIQALAGNAPALNVVTPAYIESTNLANRSELADDFRRATGQPPAGDKNARQQWEAEQQASAAQAQQLEKEKGWPRSKSARRTRSCAMRRRARPMPKPRRWSARTTWAHPRPRPWART